MELNGLFVADQHQDTLVYAGAITMNLNDISTSKRILDIDKLTLTDGGFYLREYHGEPGNNLDFLIDYFSGTGSTDTVSKPYKITVANLSLKNDRFKYEVQDDTIQPHGMDYLHLDIHDVSGDISNIHFINDSVFGKIKNLTAKERSGFVLSEFNGDAKLSSDEMRINNLSIKTPYSEINTDLTFNYDSFPDWIEFIDKMRWHSNFQFSKVSFQDIAFFAGEYLWGMKNTVNLTGECKGTVARFKIGRAHV